MKSNSKHSVGWFPFWILPIVAATISCTGILLSYYIAVTEGHVKPIPFTDITHAAIKYPEYIIFRATLIPGALLIGVALSIIAWWIQEQADSVNVVPTGLKFITNGSWSAALLLCISTATISDGGDMNWTLHTIGATGFFVVMLIVLVVISKNYSNIYKVNPNFITTLSYNTKSIINLVMIAEAITYILSAIGHILPDWTSSALEWALVLTIVIYVGTFSLDLYQVSGQLEEDPEQEELETVQPISSEEQLIDDKQHQNLFQPIATGTFVNRNNVQLYFEVASQ